MCEEVVRLRRGGGRRKCRSRSRRARGDSFKNPSHEAAWSLWFLDVFIKELFLVVRMLLVVMPGAPSSVLAPSSKATNP